jgi:hypothetical protein
MNYLHVDSAAPAYGYADETRPVTWRLLWADNRYLDGTIPPEEADYVFLQPDLSRAERAREQVAKTGNVAAATPGIDLVIVRSGQPAPRRSEAGDLAFGRVAASLADDRLDAIEAHVSSQTSAAHMPSVAVWGIQGDRVKSGFCTESRPPWTKSLFSTSAHRSPS